MGNPRLSRYDLLKLKGSPSEVTFVSFRGRYRKTAQSVSPFCLCVCWKADMDFNTFWGLICTVIKSQFSAAWQVVNIHAPQPSLRKKPFSSYYVHNIMLSLSNQSCSFLAFPLVSSPLSSLNDQLHQSCLLHSMTNPCFLPTSNDRS